MGTERNSRLQEGERGFFRSTPLSRLAIATAAMLSATMLAVAQQSLIVPHEFVAWEAVDSFRRRSKRSARQNSLRFYRPYALHTVATAAKAPRVLLAPRNMRHLTYRKVTCVLLLG